MKKIRRLLLPLVIILLMVIAAPILATYSAHILVAETDGTAYAELPITFDANNTWMAANGYMEADALDTRVETLAGTEYSHMVADDRTLVSSPVPANSNVNLYYTMGNTDLTSMNILAGYGGYHTIPDAADLEPDDGFTVDFTGYIGDDGYVVYKEASFNILRDGTDIYGFIENMTTYPTVAATSNGQSAGSGTGNYPAGIAVGDLVIVTVCGQTATTMSADAELTELWQSGSAPISGSYYRIVDGTEGATFTYTLDGAGNAGYVSYRIDTGTYYGIPEVGTAATAVDVNPNSPSLAPSFGAVNALWIATFGKSGASAVNASPANYAGSQTETANHYAAICTRDHAGASEDPGTWTIAGAETWIANTIVVRALPVYVVATGFADDEYKVEVYADGANLKIEIDDSLEDTTALGGAACADNGNDWLLSPDSYWEYFKLTTDIGGSSLKAWYQPIAIVANTNYAGAAAAGSTDIQIVDAITIGDGDDYWNGARMFIITTTDTFAPQGENAVITDFESATGTFHFAALTAALDVGDTFEVDFGTLVDRAGADNPAKITWGVNPTGVGTSVFGLVSSDQPGVWFAGQDPPPDIAPITNTTDWYGMSAADIAALAASPVHPLIEAIADFSESSPGAGDGFTELMIWRFFATAAILSLTLGAFVAVRGHIFITGLALLVGIAAAVGYHNVYPWWLLIPAVMFFMSTIIMERSPAV